MRKAIVNLMVLLIIGLTAQTAYADIDCPPSEVLMSTDDGLCSSYVNMPAPVAEVGSTITSITHNFSGGASASDASGTYPLNLTVVTYTVAYTDASGAAQSETCSVQVIIRDNELPVIHCLDDVTINNCGDIPVMPTTYTEFMATRNPAISDNCGVVEVTFTYEEVIIDIPFSCSYEVRRTYGIKDTESLLTDPQFCRESLLVRDETDPVATCPAAQTIACGTTLPLGATTFTEFQTLGGSAVDLCSDEFTVSYEDVPASTAPCDENGNPNSITRTYTVIDACENDDVCTQILTYAADTVAPVVTCPSNVTNLSCIDNLPLAETSLAGTDNCDTATTFAVTSTLDGAAPINFCGDATLTRVYSVVDACGNLGICEQVFSFAADTAGPVLTCPDDVTIACNAELPSAVLTLSGTDNCVAATSFTASALDSARPTSYCDGDTRVMTRTYTASDACSNEGTCVQSIFFTADTSGPTFTETPPADMSIACFDDAPQYGLLAATDDCDLEVAVEFSIDPPLGSLCDEGIYTYTWTATDNCGNETIATTTVTRNADETPPMDIVCIPNAEVACDGSMPSPLNSVSAWLSASGEVNDDCTSGDITISVADNGDPSLFSFCPSDGPFAITRTYTFTDGCGFSAGCDQTINFTPNTEPFVITCTGETRTFSNDFGVCGATLTLTPPAATSACGSIESVEMMIGGSAVSNPHLFEACVSTEVTWRFTDACGTTQDCVETIIVEDNGAPSFVCDDGKVISISNSNVILGYEHFYVDNSINDNCGGPYEIAVRRMSDNCGIPDNLVDGTEVEFCCGDIGEEVLVLVTVTDAKGNANTCMVSSTVSDKAPPTLVCPSNVTVSCSSTYDLTALNETFGEIAASNEERENIIVDGDIVGIDGLSSDPCGMLSITETLDDEGINCSAGALIRSFTATDSQGNLTSCSQVITMTDPDPFDASDITIPTDIERDLGCVNAPPTPEELDAEPIFAANQCSNIFYSYDDDVFKYPDSGCMHVIRNFTVIDWCQNNDQGFAPLVFGPFTQHIRLINTDSPTVTSCDDIEFCANDQTCEAEVTLNHMGTDPCTPTADLVWTWVLDVGNDGQDFISGSGSGTYSYTDEDGMQSIITGTGSGIVTTLDVGMHSIEWTVNDNCGNTDVCSQKITVRDCKAPTIACLQGLAVSLVDMSPNPPMVELWASDFNASSTDNCTPDDELTFTFESTGNGNKTFTCADVGQHPVTIIIADQDGNESRCNTYVNVQDMGEESSNNEDFEVCAGGTIPYVLPDGTMIDLGAGVYEYTVSSTTTSCSGTLTVTVTEVQYPVVTITPPGGQDCNLDLTQYTVTPVGGIWTDATGAVVTDTQNVTEGVYTYTSTNSTGCSASQQVNISCCNVTGGTLATPNAETEVSFCTSNTGQDMLVVQVAGNVGDNSAFIITDASGNITSIPAVFPVNFSGSPSGICYIYNVTYQNGLQGLSINSNIANFVGCFELSNVVTVNKLTGLDCGLNCEDIQGGCIDLEARMTYTAVKCNNSSVSFTAEVCNTDANPATEIKVVTAYTGAFNNPTNIAGPAGSTYDILSNNAIEWSIPSLSNCTNLSFDLGLVDDPSSFPYEVVVYVVSADETDSDSNPGTMIDSDNDNSLMDELSGEDDEAGVHVVMETCLDNYVWYDANENGIVDSGEQPMANVQVCLYELVNNALVAVGCNNTDASGHYEFCDLTNGEYRVSFPTNVNQSGQEYILTSQNAAGSSGQSGDVNNDSDPYTNSGYTLSYDLANGECETRVGAGYIQYVACPVTAGTISFSDGSYAVTYCTDDGKSDIPALGTDTATGSNTTWVLTDQNNIILTFASSPASYNFEGYSSGTCYFYRVAYEDGIVGLTVGGNVTALDGCFTLSNALTVHKLTGDQCPPEPCEVASTCIGGTLWIDGNENSVRDANETLLSDVSVCLYSITNNMLVYHSCVPSSSNGTYSFCNLQMGSYAVGVPPNTLINDTQHMIIDQSADSDVFPSTGFTSSITLEPESCTANVSAGYKAVNQNVCTVEGGNIYISNNIVEIKVCVDDNVSDQISVTLDNAVGSNQVWTICDGSGTILNISSTPTFEFEGQAAGVCLIRHLSYEDGIGGLQVGETISNLEGCFDLSNVFIVNKLTGGACSLFDGADQSADDDEGANVSGKVFTQEEMNIEDAEISISTNDMQKKEMTNARGEYAFSSLDMYKDYNVLPHKNNDVLNGVSVIDIIIIQRHILGLDIITSPYDLIAADINNSQTVSATDLVTLRKVILGVIDEFPNNTSWRFINAGYKFPDPESPWSFESDMMLEGLDQSYSDADFIGVKVGDLDGNVAPSANQNITSARSYDTKFLTYEDGGLSKGTEVTIPVYNTDEIDALGLQFTLELAEGANFLNVVANLKELRDIHFAHVGDNKVTISWSNYESARINKNQAVFSLKLWMEKDMKISEAIKVTSSITPALVYNEFYEEYNLDLSKGQSAGNYFELYQNKPNPFDNSTEILFNIAKADKAFVTIKNVYGQTLFTKEVPCQKGKNSIIISSSDLPATHGLLYYSVTVGAEQKTGNMIMLK